MKDPVTVFISSLDLAAAQKIVFVEDEGEKRDVLRDVLDILNADDKVIVFCVPLSQPSTSSMSLLAMSRCSLDPST